MPAPSSPSVRRSPLLQATGANLPSLEHSRGASPAERRAAALTVARYSAGLEDCRQLLDMLGLLDEMPAAS